MNTISINVKNPAEVLGCLGILALDYLLDKQIARSRFVLSTRLEAGVDGEFRSDMFEFEHPDFADFLRRCCALQQTVDNERVLVQEAGKTVLMLDWFNKSGLLFANANFSRPTTTSHCITHHRVLQNVVAQMCGVRDLFSISVEEENQHHLTAYNPLTAQSYRDRGGAYDDGNRFYASEWFLTIALQVFRHRFADTLKSGSLVYAAWQNWLPTVAAITFAGNQYRAQKAKFGQKSFVLQTAAQIENGGTQ